MLKTLQAMLQQYVNRGLPCVQTGFRKGIGTWDQIANSCWIAEKQGNFRKHLLCFIDYAKAFDCVDYNKLWKILVEMGYQTTFTCPLRNLYEGQVQQLEPDMEQLTGSKLGKGYNKAVYLSPCLFNFYADYIMWNARLDESQTGIKIAGRNINNLRYADDTTLMAESEEELKSILMKVTKESEKAGLKLNTIKN